MKFMEMQTKFSLPIILVLLLLASACSKKDDYREKYVGTYDITVIEHKSSNGPNVLNDTATGSLAVCIDDLSDENIKVLFSPNIDFSAIQANSLAYTHNNYMRNTLVPNINVNGKMGFQPGVNCIYYECLSGSIINDSIYITYSFNPHSLNINYKISGVKK